jgi:hypothetical protein
MLPSELFVVGSDRSTQLRLASARHSLVASSAGSTPSSVQEAILGQYLLRLLWRYPTLATLLSGSTSSREALSQVRRLFSHYSKLTSSRTLEPSHLIQATENEMYDRRVKVNSVVAMRDAVGAPISVEARVVEPPPS